MTRIPALRAFLTVGTIAVESLGTSRMPLAPAAISCLDRRDLAVVVAVELAGVSLQGDAEFLGLGLAPSFILTKNGFVLVLVTRPTMSAADEGALVRADARAPRWRRS